MPQVSGSETLELTATEVWDLLTDPDALATAIPGCNGFAAVDGAEHTYETALTVAVGPVTGVYEGTVEYGDIDAPNACTITVEGVGDHGTIAGSGKIALAERGDGTTSVSYEGNFKITGAVAAVGQRIAPGVSRKIIVGTLRNLSAAGQAAGAAPRPEAASTDDEEPTTDERIASRADDDPGTKPLPRPPIHGPEPAPAHVSHAAIRSAGAAEFRPFSLSPGAAYGLGVISGVALTALVTVVL